MVPVASNLNQLLPSSVAQAVIALFDVPFYLASYPDVKEGGVDPIAHYLEVGWKQQRNPSPTFNTKAYIDANPEVAKSGICPLVDYVTSGVLEDRPLAPRSPSSKLYEALIKSFDRIFYLETYSDVAAAGINPLSHYIEQGWREYRNPRADFDTRYYLEANPDVSRAGICPFIHYVSQGQREGRLSQPPSDPERDAINNARGPIERAKPWLRTPPQTVVASVLRKSLEALATQRLSGVALCLSHDDYVHVVGGVQNCIRDEEQTLREAGWAYLHLCPSQPLPILADETSEDRFLIDLTVNGERVGTVKISALLQELAHVPRAGRRILVLHHLMGFSPEIVANIATVFRPEESIAWVHDFFTLCSSWALLRNNRVFCGGPEPSSQACAICAYGGTERFRHLERMQTLFEKLRPTVLAPSKIALDFWIQHGRLSRGVTKVIPHGTITMDSDQQQQRERPELRVGFAGVPANHKGWPVFEELAARHFHDPRYAFYHLGDSPAQRARNISFVKVSVDRARRDAMIEAIRATEISVIINWSLCFETFSFTTFEALAAGAFVLARNGAGNVMPAIADTANDQGIGLDTKQELFDLFESGAIRTKATSRRAGNFQLHAGTTVYLEGLA
jgi:hypothetical protein